MSNIATGLVGWDKSYLVLVHEKAYRIVWWPNLSQYIHIKVVQILYSVPACLLFGVVSKGIN